MFTFDTLSDEPEDPLKLLIQSQIPDLLEVGENNSYWIFCNRSTKKLELVSKFTGNIDIRCTFEEAPKHGVTSLQIEAAKGVLKL